MDGLLKFNPNHAPAGSPEGGEFTSSSGEGITVFHGSPHKFSRFSASKIGSGEGNSDYGRGLYFAENRKVADAYRAQLADGHVVLDGKAQPEGTKYRNWDYALKNQYGGNFAAMYEDLMKPGRLSAENQKLLTELKDRGYGFKPGGYIYEAKIHATPDQFLDWNKPLSEQPRAAAAFRAATEAEYGKVRDSLTGNQAYTYALRVSKGVRTEKDLTDKLSAAGLAGVKYFDQQSRAGQSGSRNYVVFDPSIITTTRVEKLLKYNLNHAPGGSPQGGEFVSGPAAGGASSFRQKLASAWIAGKTSALGRNWTYLQQSARNVLAGRAGQSEGERMAKQALNAINASKPLAYPLYRGIAETTAQYKVGDTFSESLSSWTPKLGWAGKYATGDIGTHSFGPGTGGEEHTVLVMKGTNMKALPVGRWLSAQDRARMPKDFLATDEHLASGEYRVTKVTETENFHVVEVERIGNALSADLARAETTDGLLKFNENHDERGRFASADGVVFRDKGIESATDAVGALTQEGHAYRGMTEAEYKATVGAGKGIKSSQAFSTTNEGTSFAADAGTAESYANFGRDDPRKTGRSNYLVEVRGRGGMVESRDGYLKAAGPIPQDRISRVWEMRSEGGQVVGHELKPALKSELLEFTKADAQYYYDPKVGRSFKKLPVGIDWQEFGGRRDQMAHAVKKWLDQTKAHLVTELRKRDLKKAYSDDEPRDDHGRWTNDSTLPPSPGNAPIPPGQVRRYHYTSIENAQNIAKEGIKVAHSRGKQFGDPVGVWSHDANPYAHSGIPDDKALVEFHDSPGHWTHPTVSMHDVPAKNIVAIHYPHHEQARYALENGLGSKELREAGYDKAAALVQRMGKLAKYNENHAPAGSPEGGQFTSADGGMVAASPEAFVKARDTSTRAAYLNPHPPEELKDHTLLLDKTGKVGVSVDPHGDVQNIFNNGGPRGAAAHAMISAIQHGGRTLDCFDGFLPSYYHQFGWIEDSRMKFNPDYAPKGWNFERDGHPDVVFMHWAGYMQGGAKGALDRVAAGRSTWMAPERSTTYVDNWDAAKARSRQEAAAYSGRAAISKGHGAATRPAADRAGSQPLDPAGAGAGRALAKARRPARASGGGEDLTPEQQAADEQLAQDIADAIEMGDAAVLVDLVDETLTRASEEGVSRALAQMGYDDVSELFNYVDPEMVAWAAERSAELVGMRWEGDELVPSADAEMRIDETTRDMIQETISGGLAEGLTLDEIADLVEESSGYVFSPERAFMIASTEIANAASHGALSAAKKARDELNVQPLKEWLVADTPCPICEANADAGPIELDAVFPSGDDAPTAHPNCRCALIFRSEDVQQQQQQQQQQGDAGDEGDDGTTDDGSFDGEPINLLDVLGEELFAELKGQPLLKFNAHHAPAGSPQGGQFTSADVAGTGIQTPPLEKVAKYYAKQMGYDPDKVHVEDVGKEVEVNGVKMKPAAVAYTFGGGDGYQKGDIVLYRSANPPETLHTPMFQGLMAHEVQHQRFQAVLDQHAAEITQMKGIYQDMKDKGYSDRYMDLNGPLKPDGHVRDQYAAQFPVYAKLTPFIHDKIDTLSKEDGVSDYSRLYWEGVQKGTSSNLVAVHETLAEMANNHIRMGGRPLLLSTRHDEAMDGVKSSTGGSKLWQDFYGTVNDLYDRRATWKA